MTAYLNIIKLQGDTFRLRLTELQRRERRTDGADVFMAYI
jgi:hypothetical protein